MQRRDDIVLTQSAWEVGGLVLLGLAMAAAGGLMLVLDEWKGWLVLPAGALLAVVASVQLFRPDRLRITDEGFGRRGGPLSGRGYWRRWDEVSPISVRAGRRRATAGFNRVVDDAGDPVPERGYEWTEALPSYGMQPVELAAVMNERREAALGIAATSASAGRRSSPASSGAAASADRLLSVYIDASADGRRPAITGSFVPVALTLLPLGRIATRFGEGVVEGTVGGRRSRVVVIQAAGGGRVVFVGHGPRVRMLVAADGDGDAAREVVSKVVSLYGRD